MRCWHPLGSLTKSSNQRRFQGCHHQCGCQANQTVGPACPAIDPQPDEKQRVTDNPGLDWLAEHGDLLYRYAVTRVAHPEIAADLVQETFVAALKAHRDYRGDASRASWLVGILKNKIVDHYRAAARQLPQAANDPLADSPHQHAAPWPAAASKSLEDQEFWRIFDECRSRLPGTLAGAFTLREIEQLSTAEVCKILHISPTNLSVRVHRARTLLRECLATRWFGSERDGR